MLEAEPNYPPAMCTKAEILERLDRVEEAESIYTKLADQIRGQKQWDLLFNCVETRLKHK